MDILMDGDRPEGGKYSFDAENRKKLPKTVAVPEPYQPSEAHEISEAREWVKSRFPEALGQSYHFQYGISREEAFEALELFLKERFQLFGDYEDAISMNHRVAFHSVLTPYLNIGLITPQEVVDRVLEYVGQGDVIPLNSLEGFIRQVIGWREFMRIIYLRHGVFERKENFWNFTRKMPQSFYDGTTGIDPVDHVIQTLHEDAYCHHIERLMVLGNFMMLCRIDPDDVYQWFMEFFIDAYDWVMVPNVYGMSHNFTGSSVAAFPDTRKDALRRLAEFSQKVSRYSRERNYVVPGHTNVSRLSPAVRHRLITETEVAEAVLKRYSFSTVEKFLQEIYWRRYWKSWLAMRPQVWTEYLAEIEELKKGTDMAQAQLISQGEGPIFVMNDFARELIETGYLHNHARMWFAAYWIHTMRLPWQLGADFFYRHLLDADPASNTLSWRWVAGLQTLGKTYLARRSNIEKYLHRDLLSGREEGLDLLVDPTVFQPVGAVSLPAQSLLYESEQADLCNDSTTGLWVHEEDLRFREALPRTVS